jgi:hypothetical protein
VRIRHLVATADYAASAFCAVTQRRRLAEPQIRIVKDRAAARWKSNSDA